MRLSALVPVLVAAGLLWPAAAEAQQVRIQPEVGLEARVFPQGPRRQEQVETFQGSVILTGEGRWTSRDRRTRVRIEPYARLDSADEERRYLDLREASLSLRRGDWDLLAGVGQVFWGVAESRNVVDVINQFDTIEDIDEGEKLGQPMLRLSRRGGFGVIEAFYLPFFRERLFPGEEGRLRSDPVVDTEEARYERDGREWAGDFALRYANRFGDFDLGVHGFYGTSRNPVLEFNPETGRLDPFYRELVQGGVDLQYTSGPWLLKGEAVGAGIAGDAFASSVAGFEYTFFDLAESGIDLGVIGEYLYDGRDQDTAPVSLFENDAFVGTRVTFNDVQDTEILAGAIIDTETAAIQASIEFQRRIGDNMLLELEARSFTASGDPFIESLDRDDYVTLRFTRFF